MSIKKAYYYLFYKLYKFSEAAPSRWWSEWKASLAVDVLLGFLILSIGIYYNVLVDRHFDFGTKTEFVVFFLLLILVPNYFIFHHREQWRDIVAEFDKWPKRKNRVGDMIVWAVIFVIFANLIFAFYQMSLIDWKQYR